MKYFPMFLRMADETVVVCGGGEQAAQKLRLMLKTEARLVVAASNLDAEIVALVREGRVLHRASADASVLRGARLVFCATGCAGADAALAALARACGAIVNAVDRPDLCDAVTPALVDRDPLVVAIGTEGASPVLAREIRTRIEAMLEPSLGGFTAWMGGLRATVAASLPHRARRGFWEALVAGPARAAFARGDRAAAEAEAARLMAGGPPTAARVSLVGAGPGAADLITLRAVRRLQEADMIFYDRLVDPSVLELARRDAERVLVGKAPGVKSWSQDRINRLLVAAARDGRRVVRLKCGDPGIFGRAGEEIAALAAAGIAVEIVPGVTAASAAAADLGRPLTDRAGGRSVLLVSAHPAEGAPPLDWAALAATDAALAVYMGVSKAGEIAAALIAGGAPPATPVRVVERAGSAGGRSLSTNLAALPEAIRAEGLASPAVILIDPPRAAVAAAAAPRVALAG
jgi:uroporphyrin-III C-methyltransferase/precorrin-2 dehydrogenase/sirohydrochlorin ferrochelatase